MTAPTAADRAQAEAIVAQWYPMMGPKLYREKLTHLIAQALANARVDGMAQERARWVTGATPR